MKKEYRPLSVVYINTKPEYNDCLLSDGENEIRIEQIKMGDGFQYKTRIAEHKTCKVLEEFSGVLNDPIQYIQQKHFFSWLAGNIGDIILDSKL